MPDTEENIWGHFLLSSFWSHEETGCSLQKALMSLCQWVLLCFLVNFSLNKKLFHVIFERLNVLFGGHLVNFPRFNFTGSQVFLEFSEVFWMAFGWICGWLFNFFPNKWSTGISGLSVTVRPGKECRRWRLEGWLSIKLNWYSLWRHDQRDFWAELGLRSWRQGQLHWFSMCGQGWGPTGGASPGGSASTPPSSIEDVRMDLACTVLSYPTSFSPNLRASRPASRARYCFSSLTILVFRSSMVCSSYWMTVAWPSDFMSHTSWGGIQTSQLNRKSGILQTSKTRPTKLSKMYSVVTSKSSPYGNTLLVLPCVPSSLPLDFKVDYVDDHEVLRPFSN